MFTLYKTVQSVTTVSFQKVIDRCLQTVGFDSMIIDPVINGLSPN